MVYSSAGCVVAEKTYDKPSENSITSVKINVFLNFNSFISNLNYEPNLFINTIGYHFDCKKNSIFKIKGTFLSKPGLVRKEVSILNSSL